MRSVDHSKNIIELQGVSFSYNQNEVIKDVSLNIHRGDYVGVIGPNGGGKSTLIKLMLNLLQPDQGDIKLFGTSVTKFKDWYKIGYVAQKTHFEPNFPATVEEVVRMGTYSRRGLFNLTTNNDKKRVVEALKQVEMLDYRDRQISDLSGGQLQRVFIARALVSHPEVLFLDEPTVGVDVKTQKQFYKLLRKLNRDLSLTLVLASHELQVMAHEATELVYINRTLEYYGDPQEFINSDYFHKLVEKGGDHH